MLVEGISRHDDSMTMHAQAGWINIHSINRSLREISSRVASKCACWALKLFKIQRTSKIRGPHVHSAIWYIALIGASDCECMCGPDLYISGIRCTTFILQKDISCNTWVGVCKRVIRMSETIVLRTPFHARIGIVVVTMTLDLNDLFLVPLTGSSLLCVSFACQDETEWLGAFASSLVKLASDL